MEATFFKLAFSIFIGLVMLALLVKATIVIAVGLKVIWACLAPHYRATKLRPEDAQWCARELVNTPEFAKAQRQRKKVEALFSELKNQIGLHRLRLRRLKFVREQFFLAATAQNLKRPFAAVCVLLGAIGLSRTRIRLENAFDGQPKHS